MTLEKIASKLKDELSSEQLEQFIKDLKLDPDKFLNDLSESESSVTVNFNKDVEELLSRMNSDFQKHQSLLRNLTKHSQRLDSLANRLLNMNLGEIKFIMLHLGEIDPEHFLNKFFIDYFRFRMDQDKFEYLVEDRRFENFI